MTRCFVGCWKDEVAARTRKKTKLTPINMLYSENRGWQES